MQLPPTTFFAAKLSDDDGEELVVEEADEQFQYDLASDSLLSHAAKNLPATMLGWHYRSRSESLISYSNWSFYDGRLLTVPEHRRLANATDLPAAGGTAPADLLLSRPVSFHALSGVYDKRRNRAEADYIARLVASLLKRRLGLSIGVIAFSEAQQDEIEMALNRLTSEDEEFRQLLDEEWQREVDGQFVGLLVKNLENIQGDERDLIILSICYGRGPNGKMLMNFGPINKSGGEKRLNVAFSRAKQHMAVVSTIRYSEITNEYNEGANCLRNYLRYAEAMSAGDAAAAQRVLARVTRWKEQLAHLHEESHDVVIEQLAACLRPHDVALQRLGLLVLDRRVDENSQPVGAILRQPHRQIDPEVRLADPQVDDIPALPRLLRGFGWRVESVLAKDWYENREQELARLISILERSDTVTGSDELDTDDEEGDEPHDISAQSEADAAAARNESAALPEDEVGLSGEEQPVALSQDLDAHSTVPTSSLVPTAAAGKRRFEFREGNSSKFWEIVVSGREHTVRFGRIESRGQSQTKTFATEAEAQRDAERLVAEKMRKGYRKIN